MFKKTLFITLFQLLVTVVIAQESYYNDMDFTLTGTQLKEALSTKITTTHTNLLSYTPDVWEASKVTDVNVANTSEVVLLYGWEDGSDNSIDNDRTRNNTLQDSGSGASLVWNREHVYPRSSANPVLTTDDPGPGTDAHNLRPADKTRNSARSNLKFGLGSGTSGYGTSTYTGPSGPNTSAWYPGDEWKGDVARMMMYMYVRYGDQCLPSEVGVGSSEFTPDDMIDLFLNWNVEDPVSDIEKTRNSYHENTSNAYAQGNRNPFIDNPFLATRIWGGDSAEDTWGIFTSSDTEAPTTPSNITVSNITTSSMILSWTASTDNEAVTGYNVYVNGSLTTQTTQTSTTISDLSPNTSYSFTVLAKDFANNTSALSNAISGTTLSDTQSPSVPTGITIGNITDSSFKVSWTASSDNTAVAGYNVYLNNTLNAFTSELNYTISNLSSSTSYNVSVQAKDSSGNLSAQSTTQNASTTDGSSNNGVTELFFSEYIEGSGNNKALEIVNLTGSTVSLTGYEIKRQANGSGDWVTPISLDSGNITSIVPNDVFVLINGAADNTVLIAAADITTINNEDNNYGAPINFNGNDPVGLFKDGVLIDIIGTFNAGSGNFAKDVTLRRKSSISKPNDVFDANEWDEYATNIVDDIGSHSSTLNTENTVFNTFKMYPNPVYGSQVSFIIDKEAHVSIYSIIGSVVQTATISADYKNVDISKLSKGVYFVKISVNNNIVTRKLIRN